MAPPTAPPRNVSARARAYRQRYDPVSSGDALLAACERDLSEPGYPDATEWGVLRDLVRADRFDAALLLVGMACHRRAVTELGRVADYGGEWPARRAGTTGGPSAFAHGGTPAETD
jgi:hypothetical protein